MPRSSQVLGRSPPVLGPPVNPVLDYDFGPGFVKNDRRSDPVLDMVVGGAALVAREEGRQRAGAVDPVDDGDHEEDDSHRDRGHDQLWSHLHAYLLR